MARMHVCSCIGCPSHPGSCPELTLSRRCGACAHQREQARGTRYQRGYGTDHRATRDALVAAHIPGTRCIRCGQPMWTTDDLDAAHSVDLRDDPNAKADHLEHGPCNRAWRRGQRQSHPQ